MIDFEYTNLSANGTLRVVIRVTHAGQTIHADTLNLVSADGRKKFTKAVAAKFNPPDAPELAATCGYDAELTVKGEKAPNPVTPLVFLRERVSRVVEAELLGKIDELQHQPAAAEPPPDPLPFDDAEEEPNAWKPDRLSQQSNAERLVVLLDGNARYHTGRGDWLIFRASEGRFVLDETGGVARAAKRVARDTWRLLRKPPPGSDTKAAIKHAIDSEKSAGVSAMMKLAQTEAGIAAVPDSFDRDPFLLNLINGVVDLRTGRLREHRRTDLFTKVAPVKFDANAGCPLWTAFLERIMAGSEQMICYLARLAGLCLTADASVQELFIPWGDGANGKSVFFDTLTGILGDYAGIAPDTLMVASTQREHPTEIAGLCGKRLVVASETEEGAKLRIGLVKRMTGDRQLTGRFMRQDNFTFTRTHKLVLVTNKKPVIKEDTHAMWRRVRLIPFTVVIPEAERDLGLLEKLKAEWPGILNWCIAGCLDWQRDGMQTPHEVMVATAEYQADQDPLADYIAERCMRGEFARVTRNEMFADYMSWTQKTGDKHPLDKRGFLDRVRKLAGVTESTWRVNDNHVPLRGFRGIGLSFSGSQQPGEASS